MRLVLKTLIGSAALAALLFVGFIIAIDHPATRDPVRCWITETFYDLSAEPASDGTPIVLAVSSTEPVRNACDAADDPAIWMNKDAPQKSYILGTNKQRSINVYDMAGRLVSRADDLGEPNNVDIRVLGDEIVVLASDKKEPEVEGFALNPDTGALSVLKGAPFPVKVEDEVYGLCAYDAEFGAGFVITDKSGLISQYRLERTSEAWTTNHIRNRRVESQPEGCVIDDETSSFFVGEEDVGIWRYDLTSDAPGTLIASTRPDGPLVADVEGLAVYRPPVSGPSYLIASSQGDHTYAVFELHPPHMFRGKFKVRVGNEIVGDTDGLEVTSHSIGERFPRGMLVIQDGLFRDAMGKRRNQRFTYVSWQDVEDAIGLDKEK